MKNGQSQESYDVKDIVLGCSLLGGNIGSSLNLIICVSVFFFFFLASSLYKEPHLKSSQISKEKSLHDSEQVCNENWKKIQGQGMTAKLPTSSVLLQYADLLSKSSCRCYPCLYPFLLIEIQCRWKIRGRDYNIIVCWSDIDTPWLQGIGLDSGKV